MNWKTIHVTSLRDGSRGPRKKLGHLFCLQIQSKVDLILLFLFMSLCILPCYFFSQVTLGRRKAKKRGWCIHASWVDCYIKPVHKYSDSDGFKAETSWLHWKNSHHWSCCTWKKALPAINLFLFFFLNFRLHKTTHRTKKTKKTKKPKT